MSQMRSIILAAAFMLTAAPAFAENGSNGPREGAKGTNGPSSRPGGGGGIEYATVDREPSRQPTGNVAGNTGVGVCGCH